MRLDFYYTIIFAAMWLSDFLLARVFCFFFSSLSFLNKLAAVSIGRNVVAARRDGNFYYLALLESHVNGNGMNLPTFCC